jgi:hypothetical protein
VPLEGQAEPGLRRYQNVRCSVYWDEGGGVPDL